jgi:uracil-DNA glycosylase
MCSGKQECPRKASGCLIRACKPIVAVAELENLIDRMSACRICAEHLPLGPRPVFRIDPQAKILVAGQAPGRRVHETGIPFNDPSGDRLRDWMGIDRDMFYNVQKIAILPMGFCYPGTGKSGDLPPRPECVATWRKAALEHLPNIELVLAIGQYAQAWHMGGTQETLTSRVQNWPTHWPKLLPLPHPSPRNNLWLKKNPWFATDVLPVLKERVLRLTSSP